MDIWTLPQGLTVADRAYPIAWEYRQVLEVLALLADEQKPAWVRWFAAVDRFYREPVPTEHCREAMERLADFVQMGTAAPAPGPKLFDWQLDAREIISDVNRVAGFDIRDRTVHWWTFLSWFHAIGEGQLSTLVALRHKLATGQKLSEAERVFLRQNPDRVRLRAPGSPEKQRLEQLLRQADRAVFQSTGG